MKTGVELIAEERQKQILKHGFTGKHHADHPEWYDQNQLVSASQVLIERDTTLIEWHPLNWDAVWFQRLLDNPYFERLKIAAAMLAAELDRINELKERERRKNNGISRN